MKKIKTKNILLSVLFFLFCFMPLVSTAQDFGPNHRRFGLGIIAGEPTGVTGKGFLSNRLAFSGIASWSFLDDAFTLIGDFTYEVLEIPVSAREITLPFYVGGGAKLGFDRGGTNDGDTLFGVRVPVGVAAQWVNHPVEVFLEVGPGIELIPETEFDITGGLGVRYYF